MRPSDDLARIASRYTYKSYTYTVAASTEWVQMLPPDPYRWYLLFTPIAQSFGPFYVSPGGAGNTNEGIKITDFPIEWKYRDCPPVITDSWYIFGSGGGLMHILDCRFLGSD